MDTVIWAHFFEIEKKADTAPEFEDAIKAVWELGDTPGDRQLELSADDTQIRLERFTERGDWIEGGGRPGPNRQHPSRGVSGGTPA